MERPLSTVRFCLAFAVGGVSGFCDIAVARNQPSINARPRQPIALTPLFSPGVVVFGCRIGHCVASFVAVATSAKMARIARAAALRGERRRGRRNLANTALVAGATRLPMPLGDNVALVLVKPHARTPEALKFLRHMLSARRIEVLCEGSMGSAEIAARGVVDSHYASIARVAMSRNIDALDCGDVAAACFHSCFGRSMEAAIADGEVHGAMTAMEALGIGAAELQARCLAAGSSKIGSGLHCAQLSDSNGNTLYVLNGFYARLREKFLAPGVGIQWLVVRFGPHTSAQLTWRAFRDEVVGATNPRDAAPGSLRAEFRDRWRTLGLEEPPSQQDNAVHASAGPLESLRERAIWLGEDVATDPLGAALLARGWDITALLENPVVDLGVLGSARAFDLLEDVDTDTAVEALADAAHRAFTHATSETNV